MAAQALSYEIKGDDVRDVLVDGKPLAELSHTDLVDLVHGLIRHGAALRERLGSPGLERRAWANKPPEERKPGAQLHDAGGIR